MTSVVPDTVLALAELLAPDAAAGVLAEGLGSDVGAVVEVEVLEHKPGRRALLRFDTVGAGAVYGKVFPDGARAARTYDLMERMSGAVAAPRPLGVVPALGLLLYEPLLGPSLDAHVGTDELRDGLDGAGRWLATLHRSPLDLPRALDPEHEAANAATWSDTVAGAFPDLAASAARLSALLRGAVPSPVPAPVPIHKDFHYQHVITGDRIGVVDVDEARMGDPLFDVGHFLANLELLAYRSGVDAAERDRWVAAFAGGYQGGSEDGPPLRWYTAYTCMKLTKQLANGQGPRPRPEGDARHDQVAWVLDHGLEVVQ